MRLQLAIHVRLVFIKIDTVLVTEHYDDSFPNCIFRSERVCKS